MSLDSILAAATRARTLCTDLERSNRPEDQAQVAAGVRHELDSILRAARLLQEAASDAATGNYPGKVRSDAPATSRTAAQAITVQTGSIRWRILERLAIAQQSGWQGLTDLELQQILALNPSTERPRRGELMDAGLVYSSGTRRHGNTDWSIWWLTQAGADLYRERVPGPRLVVTREGEPTLFDP